MLTLGTIIFVSYLVGSIPASIFVSKLWSGIDIREHGSGNAGSTNVFRVLGWKPGVLVVLFDFTKGMCAVIYVAGINLGDAPFGNDVLQIIAGSTAVAGHVWTIFAGFRGGKGVMTTAGVYMGLAPITTLICMTLFALVAYSTRIVSIGSLTAAVALTIITVVRKYWLYHAISTPIVAVTVLVSLLIIYTHKSNIQQLVQGTENKFEKK